ncbi:hypothetical protein MKW94_019770, partial [Papaver nudicaule]|nr:hypothetical protein [Papaver nudicaule]
IQVDAYAQQVEPNTCQSSSESKRDVQDNPPEVKGTVIDEENPLEEVTKAEESFKFPSSSDKGIFMSCLTQ